MCQSLRMQHSPIRTESKAAEYAGMYFDCPEGAATVTEEAPGTPGTPVTPVTMATPKKLVKRTPTTAPSKVGTGTGTGVARKRVGSVTKVPGTPEKESLVPPVNTVAELKTFLGLLSKYAGVLAACASYNFADTLHHINLFPEPYASAGYLQGILAKAFYDEGLYTEACSTFEALRRSEPYRLDPKLMYYSSSLWQLQRDKQLAHLSQELIQMDKLSPVTQVVLGNTHSVVGEHPSAITFFQRACNIDRYHVYASALKGMEHLMLEELDDAVQAFRSSIRLDPRQYTAWHGLGAVAVKQEKWKEAAENFKRASAINPSPPLLLAYASALTEEPTPACQELALATVNRVLVHQPNHSLARLRKGEILLGMNRLHEAKEVAIGLLESCPKESKVNLLLGRVYRRMGEKIKALQYFNSALGLDPKDTPAVRYEVEKYQDGLDSGDEA
eukprot:TRINITY_DN8081_c1_g1_i1.p1 TRINITY_DN8081_c1_g1~~TRINITY_DN8081_c1_g1_i1.p1  ORF type:complete len:444 (+),score=78.10 TRINITY_DN8081_c1_g1_i1:66-1397(+)